eukprot:364682-Chlamydomonas_euryale.AAC.22
MCECTYTASPTQHYLGRAKLELTDFDIIGHAGDGSFSTVIHAVHRFSQRHYAIKVVNKHLVRGNVDSLDLQTRHTPTCSPKQDGGVH